jgi:acetyltransferase-like isoleucine patch superfamily enzyme/dTDP-4-dehydrorhamnose 3,5-epimerase-like enzyme
MSQDTFIHEKALCESADVGPGTRIWAFAHILPGAKIGSECNICDGVFIENDVTVGDRVTIKCGVQLWDATLIEDDVFIGPNATFTNDRFPRSKTYPERFLQTVVRKGASIGANATILPGLEVGSGAMVGAGAVVTRSVPPNAIAVGNPARIVGYVDAPTSDVVSEDTPIRTMSVGIAGVTLHHLPVSRDLRGSVSVGEVERNVPFVPKRYFVIFDVPGREVRGQHAHKTCHQFLLCVSGSCAVLVDDGSARREVLLNRPSLGLYLPPMVWSVQYKYTWDARLVVLASEHYDPEDYIREYGEYRRLVQG